MLRKFLCVAALAMFAAPAQAGVYGSALLLTSNMHVQRSDTELGTYTNIGPGDLTLTTTSLGLVNTARLSGHIQNQKIDVSNNIATAPDAVQAFLENGGVSAPGQNVFSQTVPSIGMGAFSRADTKATGSLLGPTGLALSSVAEIEAADTSLGSSIGSSNGSATFLFTPAQAGWYRVVFDATAETAVSSAGPPADRLASASASLTIQVNGADTSLDEPRVLFSSLVGNEGPETINLSNAVTQSIYLSADKLISLQINQVVNAGVQAVPEPATVLAFVGILAVGGISRRRRRRQLS